MAKIRLIMRREFLQLALTPALYVVLAALTALYSYAFYGETRATEKALIEPVAFLIGVLTIFWCPMLTMRTFAGETSAGTLELLLTSPVRLSAVVIGKFFGVYLFYLLSLLPFVGYAIALAFGAEVDWGMFAATALGLMAIGAAQIAAGLWISALTANVIVAAAGAGAANFLLLMLSLPIERGASVFSFPAFLSWWTHFKEIFCRGMIDTRSLFFFATFITLFWFLTWLTLGGRGAFGERKLRRFPLLLAVIFAAAAINVLLFAGIARYGGENFYTAIVGGDFFHTGLASVIAVGLLLAAIASRRIAGGEWLHIRAENFPAYAAGIAAVLIFANLNFFATRRFQSLPTFHRWDLSANQINSLAPATRAALDQLTEPLTITVFLSDNVDYEGLPLMRYVRDLLTEFTGYSAKVRAQFYDVIADPERAKQRAKELGAPTANLSETVVVDYGERRQILAVKSLLAEPDAQQRMAGIRTPSFRGELVLAITARRLSDRRATQIYFATKIGEPKMFGDDALYNSVGMFVEALGREAYQLRPWDFTGNEPPPADCDALCVVGFDRPFSAAQEAVLENYLRGGGRLFLWLPTPAMQSPFGAGRGYKIGLEKLLNGIGIRANGDLIIDEKNNFAGQVQQILALLDPDAPIKTGDPQTVLAMPSTQSFAVDDAEGEARGWILYRAVRSLSPSRRFTPTAAKPMPESAADFVTGAATVAVAAAKPADKYTPEARIVVTGSTGAGSNLFFEREGNAQFLLAAARWLVGRHYQVEVAQRNYLTYSVNFTASGWRYLRWLTQVAMPEFWLFLGAIIWWRRRE